MAHSEPNRLHRPPAFSWRRLLARVPVVALVAAALVGTVAGPASAGAVPTTTFAMVQEPFTGSNVQVPGQWVDPPLVSGGSNVACLTASSDTAQQPVPGCGSPADQSGQGALRLTSANNTLEGGTASTQPVPSSAGLDVHFDTYQYGSGTQADGIMFFLQAADPASPAVQALGQSGGALAYANTGTSPGMVDGYLGVGFDVYGNYDNNDVGGSTCNLPSYEGRGQTMPNEVSVRGPGSGTSGYCMLSSTAANGGLGGGALGTGSTGTRASSLVPVEVAVNPTSAAMTTSSGLQVPARSYEVAVTPLGAATQYLSGSLPYDTFVPSG